MLNISTANINDTKNLLVIDVKDVAPGTYSFNSHPKIGEPSASYMPDVLDVSNTYTFNSGNVTISSNDGTLVNATFEGSGKNKKGELITISKGKLSKGKIHNRLTSN